MGGKSSRTVGRPVAFDRDRALDCAMRVFWRRGFEGASLKDLTAAMGIQPPSLYAAFGNKRALFEDCLRRYLAGPAAYMNQALDEPTAYQVAARILRDTAEFLAKDKSRSGCMTIQAALVGGADSAPLRRGLTLLRLKGQRALQRRLERARAEDDLPETADPADLARFITAVFQGMTVQAINGAKREELLRIGEMALQVWPR